jgi:hypothetical protein
MELNFDWVLLHGWATIPDEELGIKSAVGSCFIFDRLSHV